MDLLGEIPYSDGDRGDYDCVVGAVSHNAYAAMGPEDFRRLLTAGGLLADIKGMWRKIDVPEETRRWQI